VEFEKRKTELSLGAQVALTEMEKTITVKKELHVKNLLEISSGMEKEISEKKENHVKFLGKISSEMEKEISDKKDKHTKLLVELSSEMEKQISKEKEIVSEMEKRDLHKKTKSRETCGGNGKRNFQDKSKSCGQFAKNFCRYRERKFRKKE